MKNIDSSKKISLNKLIIFIILFCVVVIILGFIIITKKNNKGKISKGYEIFENEYCEGHLVSPATGWPSYITCRICGNNKKNTKHNTNAIICPECTKITKRCDNCGKLLKK